jgi:hypothetical protein
MIPNELVSGLNSIRECFLDSLDCLDRSVSFQSLLQSVATLKDNYEQTKSNLSEKLLHPFEDRFVVAIVGSSGHGKTTILNEIFPSLAQRGWLVTDVTDTTSQSLRIEYAPQSSESHNRVTVNSWRIEQIKKLLNLEEVAYQNQKDNIHVEYREDAVHVDGNEATFPPEDVKQFHFALNQSLVPFPQPYSVPEERLFDEGFIQSLTTKEPYSRLNTKPVIVIDGCEYNSLQLRVVVKDISLHDDFDSISQWTGLNENERNKLIFIDTPGIAVSGSIKDEVLRHPLEYKSNQILLELIRDDELDVLVHLVLCGRHSDFSVLWKALEREYGVVKVEDLSERLVLAVNGANIYFNNVDVKKHVQNGDHFEITLSENVLQKMSPRGWLKPAKICFLDSSNIVDNAYGMKMYKEIYAKFRTEMEQWLTPGTKPHEFLQENNLLESFPQNIEALCDPDDRGQGYMVRQVVELLHEKGPVLFIKKYAIRTELLNRCEQLLEIVKQYYNDDGCANYQTVLQAVQKVFKDAGITNFDEIQDLCNEKVDPYIETIIQRHLGKDNWIVSSFSDCCVALLEVVLEKAKPNQDVSTVLKEYFNKQIENWYYSWGYSSARVPIPNDANTRTLHLLAHSIKTHMREILYQLALNRDSLNGLQSMHQTEEEMKSIAELIAGLKNAIEMGETFCRRYGVSR